MSGNETLHGEPPVASPARVLVVDDNSTNRLKLRKAVQALGHETEVAKDGHDALQSIARTDFDAVLLDIIMPGLDGFDVLRQLKSDEKLRDIPVIVVSALDDEVESVVRAIELGAEDFLPKEFDPVLLKARLGASLTKKRFRDQELEYFGRIDRLTKAAAVLEEGRFNPESLNLDDLAAKPDPLGRLATVFRGMATEIYERELKLKQAIDTLRGSVWVIAIGVIWGLTPSLGRLAASEGANALGIVAWTNPILSVVFLSIAAKNRNLPALNLANVAFFIAWALIAGVLQRVVTFTASAHVEAAIISLVLTLQGFMVFAFSAATEMEFASPRRLLGLFVGLSGVALVLIARIGGENNIQIFWLLFALLIPLLLAIEVLVMAGKRPSGLDDVAAIGMMMLFSSIIVVPWAYSSGQIITLQILSPGKLEFTVLGLIGISFSSYLMAFYVIRTAGAVFYSQTAYTMTIAGVLWGVLILNEQLTPLAWLAFAVIVFGMYLVEPNKDKKELIIRRKFGVK